MGKEETDLYDRAIRVWGEEVQKKHIFHNFINNYRLKNARVMIVPLTPCNADLAKNLVLAGVSLVIFDDEKVRQQDFEDNPLVLKDDIGKNVNQILKSLIKKRG